MSGMTKGLVRAGATLAVTVGAMTALAGPAAAYDRANCDNTFGADNVRVATTFKIETGTTGQFDFGDDFHLFGTPMGTAVACSSKSGGVRVLGKAFPDGATLVNPQVRVQFLRSNVVAKTSWHGLTVDELRFGGAAGPFTKVRITLFIAGADLVAQGGQKTLSV